MESSLVIAIYTGGEAKECALCCTSIKSESGHILCRSHTLAPVCRECGLKQEPSLVRLLDLGGAIEAYARAERETNLQPPAEAQTALSAPDSIASAVANAFSGRATITDREFCKIVGLSTMTVYRLRQKGILGYYQQGARILYGPQHVLEYLQSREIKARKPR